MRRLRVSGPRHIAWRPRGLRRPCLLYTSFNPLDCPEADTSLGADEREIGGLGILLVKKTMDKVEYEYKDGKNILTITKRL